METAHGYGVRRAVLARRIAVGIVLLGVLTGTLTAAALATSKRSDPTFTAVDVASGRQLPHDPELQRGQRIVITVRGFGPRVRVTVGLVGVRLYGVVRSDRAGRVVYPYAVPRTLRNGRWQLIFSGSPATLAKHKARAPRSSRTSDRQAFVVTVPFDPAWPFRLGGRAHHPPPPWHSSHGAGGQHGKGPTSYTGVDVLALVAAALAALGAGVALLRLARRKGRRT